LATSGAASHRASPPATDPLRRFADPCCRSKRAADHAALASLNDRQRHRATRDSGVIRLPPTDWTSAPTSHRGRSLAMPPTRSVDVISTSWLTSIGRTDFGTAQHWQQYPVTLMLRGYGVHSSTPFDARDVVGGSKGQLWASFGACLAARQ
jgi:hypothetical protein